MFKRLLPIAGLLGAMSIMLAGSAAAGGPGGYGGPGLLKFDDWSANANLFDPTTGSSYANLFVDRGMQSFKLKHNPGAPVVEQFATVLNVFEQTSTGFAYGCWIIPDSSFVIASNLSGATLSAQGTSANQCPGLYVGSATGGKPSLQSTLGFGPEGPGGPPTLITDITVQMTWTGNGGLWENQNSGTSHCQNYTASFHGSFDYEYAPATGTLGTFGSISDPLAQVAHNTQSFNSSTAPSAACNPYGF